MMCLICFLGEKFQYELRTSSKMRSDRFEHTLCKYKSSFIREFNENLDKLCDKHNNDKNLKIVNILKNIEIDNINIFFDTLINIYISWINADLPEAIKSFDTLLHDYNILSEYEDIDNLVLFRGRTCDSFISHWDMFHIPFNKRFYIKNQRYSLVGQPLLYLGTSPYCVYRELENSKDLKISSFRFKEKSNMKIFNNSNLFYRYIKKNFNANNESSITECTDRMIVDEEEKLEELEEEEVVQKFYLLILASVCSFQRRDELKNTSFCEEYVLPQILAQVLKNNNVDGIMYTSTKSYYDTLGVEEESIINHIYKNICIFTNYDKSKVDDVTYVYDKKLYEKFIVSAPIAFDIKLDEAYFSIKKTLELIKGFMTENRISKMNEDTIYVILDMLISYMDIKGDIDNDDFKVSRNLHYLFLRNIILNIIEKVKEDEIINE